MKKNINDPFRIHKVFYKQACKLAFSMILSVFIYGWVGFYAIKTGYAGRVVIDMGTYRLFQVIAFAVSFLAVMGSRYWSERLLSIPQKNVSGEGLRQPKRLYITTLICCLGGEVPVLAGMILLFLSHDFYGFIPFGFLALVALALAFPRKQRWEPWLGVKL